MTLKSYLEDDKMISTYRKKPVEIQAVLWDDREETIVDLCQLMRKSSAVPESDIYIKKDGTLCIATLDTKIRPDCENKEYRIWCDAGKTNIVQGARFCPWCGTKLEDSE